MVYICKPQEEKEWFVNRFGSKEGNFNVRTDIFNGEDFQAFLKRVSAEAKVNFVVRKSTDPSLKHYVWSKSYICHHSGKNSTRKDLR